MTWMQALILGAVQGLTEFLPISSSAHLRIVSAVFFGDDAGASFTAVTQLGTEAAVVVYFAKDIWRIVQAWFTTLYLRLTASSRQPVPVSEQVTTQLPVYTGGGGGGAGGGGGGGGGAGGAGRGGGVLGGGPHTAG
ncbi:undecaprenyl-diphosphate phosphatase, partial [Nocardia wallacei]|uniref:undecaprenyl-diphosphate phosphatase n=1 Tax=Nocardia wallacei TaxID=480035 RepID=UPI002455B586